MDSMSAPPALARRLAPLQTGASAPLLAAGSSTLRLLTWNVLADGLAQNGDFVKARGARRRGPRARR
jgi:hypothetical protein